MLIVLIAPKLLACPRPIRILNERGALNMDRGLLWISSSAHGSDFLCIAPFFVPTNLLGTLGVIVVTL